MDTKTLAIVPHPHPALRYKSTPVPEITTELSETIRSMFELMYEANGIGLAANQVGIPKRFFVVNLSGEEADPEEEFVFINPVIKSRRGSAVAEEGCLSLPKLYGDVKRPEAVTIQAYDLEGQPFEMKLEDLPARVVQHELDHLDGTMFIDRMEAAAREEIAGRVEEFVIEWQAKQQAGDVPPDEEIEAGLREMAGE